MRADDEAWTEIVGGWEGQNRKQTISEKREGVYLILMLLLQYLSASSKSGFFLDVFPALEDSGFAGNLRFLKILS